MAGKAYVPNVHTLLGKRPPGYAVSMVRADVQNAINAGLNQTQAFEAYKAAGLGINYPLFRKIYNQKQAELKSARKNAPKSIPQDSPKTKWERRALSGESQYRYKDNFQGAVYDNTTGRIELKTLAVYHNEPLTMIELHEQALGMFDKLAAATKTTRAVLSVSLADSFVNRGWGQGITP